VAATALPLGNFEPASAPAEIHFLVQAALPHETAKRKRVRMNPLAMFDAFVDAKVAMLVDLFARLAVRDQSAYGTYARVDSKLRVAR